MIHTLSRRLTAARLSTLSLVCLSALNLAACVTTDGTGAGVPTAGVSRASFDAPFLNGESAREMVAHTGKEKAGTVVIDTRTRTLSLVQGGGKALQYKVGVGKEGFQWAGVNRISRKGEWPDWTPPSQMLKRRPDLPRFMKGGPANPLGARAMYLGSTLFRIHGSNEPKSIGTAVSSGCIRMHNADVIDLYERVKVGTTVVVRR